MTIKPVLNSKKWGTYNSLKDNKPIQEGILGAILDPQLEKIYTRTAKTLLRLRKAYDLTSSEGVKAYKERCVKLLDGTVKEPNLDIKKAKRLYEQVLPNDSKTESKTLETNVTQYNEDVKQYIKDEFEKYAEIYSKMDFNKIYKELINEWDGTTARVLAINQTVGDTRKYTMEAIRPIIEKISELIAGKVFEKDMISEEQKKDFEDFIFNKVENRYKCFMSAFSNHMKGQSTSEKNFHVLFSMQQRMRKLKDRTGSEIKFLFITTNKKVKG